MNKKSKEYAKLRIGEINYNTNGEKMTIIEYNNKRDVVVKFENNYKVNTRYDSFSNGYIKNPYTPNVCGVGYIGIGKYKSEVKGKSQKQYSHWASMMQRCYSKDYHEKFPTYKECLVCEEWYNYQTFAKWYDENYYTINDERMCLDKDILVKGNKIYSPNTCVFVSNDINMLFIKNNKLRGDLPIGVNFDISKNKYIAQCNVKNKLRKLGIFYNPTDAFYKGYKIAKEKYIKQIADEYKDKIPIVLYEAMYNYIVEITD